jgi:hypothetical protein
MVRRIGKRKRSVRVGSACQINDFFHTDVDIKTGMKKFYPCDGFCCCVVVKNEQQRYRNCSAIVQPLCVQCD